MNKEKIATQGRALGRSIRNVAVWSAMILGGIYILLLLIRFPFWFEHQKTVDVVARIHTTKLSYDDVMGAHLPPDPGSQTDRTLQGVDANHNGIRDDVEREIFQTYPNSARIRLPLLQYALSLQLQIMLPLVNTDTVTATVADTHSRANRCLWTLSSRSDMQTFSADIEHYKNFVTTLQLNTAQRKKYVDDLYEYLRSYQASNAGCDIIPSTLPN
jgi:hypothetical protein